MCIFTAAFFLYYQLVFLPPALKYWEHEFDMRMYGEFFNEHKKEGKEPPAEILAEYEAIKNENPQIVIPGIGLTILGVLFLASALILPPRMKAQPVRSYYRAMKEIIEQISHHFSEEQVRLQYERIASNPPLGDKLKQPLIIILLVIIFIYQINVRTGEISKEGFNPALHPLVLFNLGIMLVMAVYLVTCCRFKTKHEAKLEILAWIANEPAEGLDDI